MPKITCPVNWSAYLIKLEDYNKKILRATLIFAIGSFLTVKLLFRYEEIPD